MVGVLMFMVDMEVAEVQQLRVEQVLVIMGVGLAQVLVQLVEHIQTEQEMVVVLEQRFVAVMGIHVEQEVEVEVREHQELQQKVFHFMYKETYLLQEELLQGLE